MTNTISLRVWGRVQGVGFRYFTKVEADQLGITGYVQNKLDGSVYTVAQGNPIVLKQFIQKVKQSPSPYGKVTRFELNALFNEPTYTTFDITN